ncbi:MAG: DNA polymerase/3'-5' exonuclease PolX [Halobacteria archaeon]
MKNREVADKLNEIADMLEMKDVEWKPRAYRRAARNIESLSEGIEDIHQRGDLEDIDAVGEGIAKKIGRFLDQGEMEYYEELKQELPVDIEAITKIEGIGPKSVRDFYRELGIETLDDLEEAAEEGRISSIKGYGEKTSEKILDGIETARRSQERMLLGNAFPIAESIKEWLTEEAVGKATVVGSYRRRKPTVGDIDVLATSDEPKESMEKFTSHRDVKQVLVEGETKSSVVLAGDLRVDLRIVEDSSYGSALQYFTGSKDHNIAVRTVAQEEGLKLNEYGLYDNDEKLVGETEEGVYGALDIEYVPPELREDTGEVDAALNDELPELVELEEIEGDLQMHTTYSDGQASVREMAEKADELGYSYILLTDHGPHLRVAGGPETVEDIREMDEEVKKVNSEVGVEVLLGVEANVVDGDIDVTREFTDLCDLVVMSLHSATEEPTREYLSVLDDRGTEVDIIGHPFNRLINERKPLDLDMDELIRTAAEKDVAMEINSQPQRLDLPWNYVKQYRGDVKYVISTDAHTPGEMDYMHLGVDQARRGWCRTEDVLNTRSLDGLMDYFG